MIEKLAKLRHMSASELAHRAREQMRIATDRMRTPDDADPELDDLIKRHGSSLKSYFAYGPARRFYASVQERNGVVSFLNELHPEWHDRAVQEAKALCEHRVNLLAYRDVELGKSIDWHRDPITGFQWPKRFWADYDLVHAPAVDAKIIHELNRHQHLPRLAKAFFLTGDESCAREAISQIESWIEQNPKWQGVNWQSSLELSIRCMSWLWTLLFLLPSTTLNEASLRRICRCLFAQLDHISRYPSTYTSPNTHLIGEAASLFIAGVLFPEVPRSQQWRDFGMHTLLDEMERQVSRDGVHAELSTYYHCYAADFYLHAFALARKNRIAVPDRSWDRLARMFDFVMHMTRPDGTLPLIGDDDGGRALALSSQNYTSYRDGLSSGSVLFARPDFKHQAQEFLEESLWLLGTEAWPLFDSLPATCPTELHQGFEDSGYFIQRSGWGSNDTQVVFDCGGMGMGSGGHSHSDGLSLTLFSGGREFLIDPGTSVYNAAPEWRRYFRSTAAHNTVLVDDRGQCEPAGTFTWKQKTAKCLQKHAALVGIDYIEGTVEIRGASQKCSHRRRLVHVEPDYWIVLDDLRGKGNHNFDFFYHFGPETQLTVLSDEGHGEIHCKARIGDSQLQMFMYASEAALTEVQKGWSSQIYGDRRASTVLKASMRGVPPVAMMSFLCPGNPATRTLRFKTNTNHAIGASIRNDEYDDLAVMALDDGELHFQDYVMRGEFFWLRLEQGNLVRMVAVNAYSFKYAGETVFESDKLSSHVQVSFCESGMLIERTEEGGGPGKIYVRDLRNRQFQQN